MELWKNIKEKVDVAPSNLRLEFSMKILHWPHQMFCVKKSEKSNSETTSWWRNEGKLCKDSTLQSYHYGNWIRNWRRKGLPCNMLV